MEALFAIGIIILLWNFFSTLAKQKTKHHNPTATPKATPTSNSLTSYDSNQYTGTSNSNQYTGTSPTRTPYVPISKSASGIPIKSDTGYRGPFRDTGRRKSDFSYPENPNPQEILVYFIASEELGALKIGVGTSGRVLQLLNSTVRSESGIENVGWKVLKTAAFSTGPSDFESGRDSAFEAERRVLYYWKKYLRQPAKVSERDMGWAELNYLGSRGFHLTKGYTETVDIENVCENTSWNIVKNSPGFLGEGSSFFSHRDLKFNSQYSLGFYTPPGYVKYKESLNREQRKAGYSSKGDLNSNDYEPAEKASHSCLASVPMSPPIRKNKQMPKSDGTKDGKFWARVEKLPNGCWNWIGSLTTNSGYAQMLWEGRPQLGHRIAWQLLHDEVSEEYFLTNICGKRTCVNPEHWEHTIQKKLGERGCMTPDCEGVSIKKRVDGYCKKCERHREYEYRKNRPNPYVCTNPGCDNPSGTVAFASLCMSCRRKQAKG